MHQSGKNYITVFSARFESAIDDLIEELPDEELWDKIVDVPQVIALKERQLDELDSQAYMLWQSLQHP